MLAKLILEKLDRDGNLLERREQQARSFVLQFIDMLYSRHAQADRATKDITNTARTLDYDESSNKQLMVASPPGHGGFSKDSYKSVVPNLEGQDIGIQVGKGSTAPTPTDYKIEDRIGHSRCGKVGAKANFLNPSFETGDLTNWVEVNNGAMDAAVSNAAWALKDLTWFCTLLSTGAYVAGDYSQVSQDIDLTSITHLRFQLRGDVGGANFHFEVLVDGRVVYGREMASNTDYADQIANVCAYTGTHTITFRCTAFSPGAYAGNGAFIDNVETLNLVELEYGGTEISLPIFGSLNHNGEFTIRRYFTNSSGASVTINEVGIYSMGAIVGPHCYSFLIARDVVSPGVDVEAGQMLRVTYVPQITV